MFTDPVDGSTATIRSPTEITIALDGSTEGTDLRNFRMFLAAIIAIPTTDPVTVDVVADGIARRISLAGQKRVTIESIGTNESLT